MSKLKSFVEQLRTEMLYSEQQFCVYCGEEASENCCGENHFAQFADLFEDVQNIILDAEIKQYERATK